MPVWHASLSLWTPGFTGRVSAPGRMERAAVDVLAGVGGDREWWVWRPRTRIAHLRVALTEAEAAEVPCGIVTSDAGESGPERPRTLPRI